MKFVIAVVLAAAWAMPEAHAASATPAKAAVGFLEKIREGNIDLEPGKGTAITANISPGKREEIDRWLKRIAKDISNGELNAGEVKIDQDLAAVLVSDSDGYDPARWRVYGIALMKHGGEWLPAPVPASFENTGSSYQSDLRQRMESLETWMLDGQVTWMEALRDQAGEKMRQHFALSISPDELRKMSATQVQQRFTQACIDKNLDLMLALLGGLQKTPPADWNLLVRRARDTTSAKLKDTDPWRLLSSPEVLRIPMTQNLGTHQASLVTAYLDPSNPNIWLLTLKLSQDSDGLWRVDLPKALLDSENDAYEAIQELELDSYPEFQSRLREQIPLQPSADFNSAVSAFHAGLEKKDLTGLLANIHLNDDPERTKRTCAKLARDWRGAHPLDSFVIPVKLATHEAGSRGVAAYQFFSTTSPTKSDIRLFYFSNTSDGWMLESEETSAGVDGEDFDEIHRWVGDSQRKWHNEWVSTLLANATPIEAIQPGQPPTKEDAEKLVREWITKTQATDVSGALQLAATFTDPRGAAKSVQNLSFEIKAHGNSEKTPQILQTKVGKTWAAVSVESTNGEEQKPVYAVINTKLGPRLMLEVDLFTGGSRGREFLNRTSLERLKKFAPPEVVDELGNLLQQFDQ
ncbi:hypothetical protein JIN85_12925 [Luteolibacter pohnpeiensis]|uniref:DUF4132 domain-containing protein n=1 Tax=Luteolibacter pohnpeiensis TaxID=454153 RepID=A0A934SDP3_9BACT|nr:hypothetical protein [Luteolibacter pohnpeiensis]MBK1883323.1 hypothetical protein [Luteolibacter pohnpeiensis]